MITLTKDWYQKLQPEFEQPYFKQLQKFLTEEYNSKTIYPESKNIFNALNCSKYQDIKVVIFGQDPYYMPNQAHGFAFSVLDDVKIPPSLVNIFKEIESELGIQTIKNGNLTRWAKQGVLLLNTVLTVEHGKPNSHKNKGWENITKQIVKLLNQRKDPIIFLLWGANAKEFETLINTQVHTVLKAPHPSPLSAYNGFWGCGHFKKTNEILVSLGKTPIDWR